MCFRTASLGHLHNWNWGGKPYKRIFRVFERLQRLRYAGTVMEFGKSGKFWIQLPAGSRGAGGRLLATRRRWLEQTDLATNKNGNPIKVDEETLFDGRLAEFLLRAHDSKYVPRVQ